MPALEVAEVPAQEVVGDEVVGDEPAVAAAARVVVGFEGLRLALEDQARDPLLPRKVLDAVVPPEVARPGEEAEGRVGGVVLPDVEFGILPEVGLGRRVAREAEEGVGESEAVGVGETVALFDQVVDVDEAGGPEVGGDHVLEVPLAGVPLLHQVEVMEQDVPEDAGAGGVAGQVVVEAGGDGPLDSPPAHVARERLPRPLHVALRGVGGGQAFVGKGGGGVQAAEPDAVPRERVPEPLDRGRCPGHVGRAEEEGVPAVAEGVVEGPGLEPALAGIGVVGEGHPAPVEGQDGGVVHRAAQEEAMAAREGGLVEGAVGPDGQVEAGGLPDDAADVVGHGAPRRGGRGDDLRALAQVGDEVEVLELGDHGHPVSSLRTIFVPSTRALSLRKASQRGSWKKPQSGQTCSFSGETCRRASRMRSATSCGVST